MPFISIITDRKHGRKHLSFFTSLQNRTVDCVGSKTVAVRTTGHEKTHISPQSSDVWQMALSFPQWSSLKEIQCPKEKFPIGVIVHVHQKGWIGHWRNVDLVTEIVGRRQSGGKSKEPDCLGPISCTSRRQGEATYKQRPQHQQLLSSPGGPTSILLPLDVSVNHPFKCKLREQWSAWMMSDTVEHPAAVNPRRPSLPIVTQWVKTAWDSIDPAIIVRAFQEMLDH